MQDEWYERYTPEPNSGCWLWLGKCDRMGYGRLHRRPKEIFAHRAMWELHNHQTIPSGMSVCHKCDNPSCVNPDHLFLGSHGENMRDMWAKGRGSKPPRNDVRGGKNINAKLTAEQIIEIRKSPERQNRLAAKYGVSCALICLVKARRVWAHLPD